MSVLLFGIIAAAGGAYLRIASHYKDHFLKGTQINGFDCSSLTVDEVEEKLREELEDYSLTIRFRDGAERTLSRSDIGYRYVSDGSVARLMEQQEPLRWINSFLESDRTEEYSFSTETEFSEEKLREALNALPEFHPDHMIAPTDAYLEFQENTFVIIPETEGSSINTELVFEAACAAASESRSNLTVDEIENAYAIPAISRDSEVLIRERDRLNSLIAPSITYDLRFGPKTLDGATLINWLVKDEDGNYQKDQEVWDANIASFIEELAEQVDTIGDERTFPGTGIGDVTVSGGDYGSQLDVEAETTQLSEELAGGVVITREPNYLQPEFGKENGGLGTTYIEIDLSRQHLWFYQEGVLILESDIVSGTMNERRWTPPGVFYVKLITTDKILRGPRLPNGKYEYESPVSYWMPFNLDIGLHDATWRGAFGGDIYVWSGSHGCINLPLENARLIYENITYQTPVVCYYSQPYELY